VPANVGVALWVDPVVHASECRRFDSYVVKGPRPEDCEFFTGAIGKDEYGRFFIYRGGTGICVRPNRYAFARWLGVPLEPDQLALHECDHLLCVKVCAADAPRQHVVAGDQIDNMPRMARMQRGGGRSAIPSPKFLVDGLACVR